MKNKEKRVGFHSIESIIKNNPHKIKKLFLPYSRDDSRLNNLIALSESNGINFEVSKKLKQDPEAIIINEEMLNFKDLKNFLIDSEKDELFCSFNCIRFYHRDEKIKIALNRILMDRALYSKYSSSLINIFMKIYSYITNCDDKEIREQMFKRMLEELEEMSGTCSSGYATRLINIISGFGNFNIRISWEDQIVSNFSGRLNAAARTITSNYNSMFRETKLYDVIELWLNYKENIEILDKFGYSV